jgi:hypothetical protein
VVEAFLPVSVTLGADGKVEVQPRTTG